MKTRLDSYQAFVAAVRAAGLTPAQVRGDVPPPQAVFDLMDRFPKYETYAARYCREVGYRA